MSNSPDSQPTPLTDAQLIEKLICGEGDEDYTVYPAQEIVDADFARQLERERDRLAARVAALEEALKPFAQLAMQIDGWRHEDNSTCLHRLHAKDVRAARAALNPS